MTTLPVTTTPTEENLVRATEGRGHFSTRIPGNQIAWDSTSLGDFKTCPRKYFYSHVLGLRGRREAVALTFGIHYHAGLEKYDRYRFEGDDHEVALRKVVRYLLEATVRREPPEVPLDEETGEALEHLARPGKIIPWNSDDTKRNRFTLIRSVVWYLEQFGENDVLRTVALADGKPAVELSFRFELPQLVPKGETEPYLLCGHMDRVADYSEIGLYVVDRKTTGGQLGQNFFDNYSPDNQMSLYTLAAKVVYKLPVLGVIIDGAQVQVGSTRFQRGFVSRTKPQIEEWLRDLGYWFGLAERYARDRYWPMNDKACGMYGGCQYRRVCSRDPSVRPAYIASDFEHRPWNPLEPRGE